MAASPLLAAFYCTTNILVSVSIVFANKLVFSRYNFKFVYALTWIHAVCTCFGMRVLARLGFFESKAIPVLKVLPVAIGFVGSVVLCNMSLAMNSVGFYQIMKVAVSPALVLLELLLLGRHQSASVLCSVLVVCLGIAIATVTDKVVIHNIVGLLVGVAATVVTALYQVLVGSKGVELQANSSQLLQASSLHAIWLLGLLVPALEPVGWTNPVPGTLLGYTLTVESAAVIGLSALLGTFVSLTTFLVISTTSSLTYGMVGHLKTVLILAGGVLLFQDSMSWDRVIGLGVAVAGIAWYTQLARPAPPAPVGVLAPLVVAMGPGAGGYRVLEGQAAKGGAGARQQGV